MAKNTNKAVNASVAASQAASTSEVKATAETTVKIQYSMNDIVEITKQIRAINKQISENPCYSEIQKISTSVTYGKISAKKASVESSYISTIGNFGYNIQIKCRNKEWYLSASVSGLSLDGVSVKVLRDKEGKCKLSQNDSRKALEETSISLRDGVCKDIADYLRLKGLTSKSFDSLAKDYCTKLELRLAYTKKCISVIDAFTKNAPAANPDSNASKAIA